MASLRPMDQDVKALLDQLESTRSDRTMLDDPGLNEQLDRFRGVGPFPVRCTKCAAKFSWWALHPVLPQIVFSSNGPRRRHIWDPTSRPKLGPRSPAPFDEWSRGPSDGIDTAKNVDPKGGFNRWKFTCPQCSSTYTYTVARMMQMFVRYAAEPWRGHIPA